MPSWCKPYEQGTWCSGLTCSPVKAETAGSNPLASAEELYLLVGLFLLH